MRLIHWMEVNARSVSITTIILMVDVMWTFWVAECTTLVIYVWNVKKTTFWLTIIVVIRHVYHKCIEKAIRVYLMELLGHRKVKGSRSY